jgi:hypothetical protein
VFSVANPCVLYLFKRTVGSATTMLSIMHDNPEGRTGLIRLVESPYSTGRSLEPDNFLTNTYLHLCARSICLSTKLIPKD